MADLQVGPRNVAVLPAGLLLEIVQNVSVASAGCAKVGMVNDSVGSEVVGHCTRLDTVNDKHTGTLQLSRVWIVLFPEDKVIDGVRGNTLNSSHRGRMRPLSRDRIDDWVPERESGVVGNRCCDVRAE